MPYYFFFNFILECEWWHSKNYKRSCIYTWQNLEGPSDIRGTGIKKMAKSWATLKMNNYNNFIGYTKPYQKHFHLDLSEFLTLSQCLLILLETNINRIKSYTLEVIVNFNSTSNLILTRKGRKNHKGWCYKKATSTSLHGYIQSSYTKSVWPK